MRILYASRRPPYPYFLGGAARCAHRLLLALIEGHGAVCRAVGDAGYAGAAWAVPAPADRAALGVRGLDADGGVDVGYPVQALANFESELTAAVTTFRPDVVWTQIDGAHEVLALARQLGVPGLLYVHDAEDKPEALRAAADLGCHVVCSSAFLAARTRAIVGREVHVVYPASDWYFGSAGNAAGRITFVNPHPVKGLDTFVEIARRLPEERFLVHESWPLAEPTWQALQARMSALPNVRLQRRTADMRAVYAQTRLLIAPSRWEEGFGMVAVEAQSCGIPVVASARGGLPEAVGDGGLLVERHLDVDAWVAAIRALTGSTAAYRAAAARALAHAATFRPEEQARRFAAICARPVPAPTGALARGVRRLRRVFAEGVR